MNYSDAAAFLSGGRNKSSRSIANNTRVERIDAETIGIRLHDTYVVKIHSDGSWQLFTGGWYTVTTKDRINLFAPTRVGSDRGRWYVYSDDWENRTPFFEGIAVSQNGTVLNPRATLASEERERKEIERNLASYIKGFIAALRDGEVGLPGPGDCWGCSMQVTEGSDKGKTAGDIGFASDHLLGHISPDERYFVPSLLFNAVRERGYGDWRLVMSARLDMEAYEAGRLKLRDSRDGGEFGRDLRRYLKKRLLPGGGVTPPGVGVTAIVGSGYYGI